MKKKILINGRFSSHHFAIRNVIYNIAFQLSKSDDYEVYIILNRDSEISDFEQLNLKILFNESPADSAMKNHLFTMFRLPRILKKHNIDLVIYPQICFFLKNPCKSLLYMHDLIEYKIESQSKKKLIFRKVSYPYICRVADHIVAVSENTKKDLIDILHVPQDKISVAYDGADQNLKPIDKTVAKEYVKSKYNIKNYIFYIGYLTHPQKNLLYLISEFKRFQQIYPDYQLVFAGPKGKDADMILEFAKETGIPFSYLGKVPYKDLAYLYSGCECFCFPSLYEGFGMPVLEAMKCGAPVITSDVSSLPEIQTNKNWLINPKVSGELTDKLQKIIHEDINRLEEENIVESKKFSWDNHGYSLKKIISKIL